MDREPFAGALPGTQFLLEPRDEGLSLRALHRPEYGALTLDWLSAEQRRRIQGGRKQLIAKALGLPKKHDAVIVDATAGLGRDGFTLAALGARVTLLERSPVLVEMLEDARRRTLESAEAPLREAASRIHIIQADAREWLSALTHPVDAIHLDPMYPEDGKSALPQKAMQLLRDLTGGDDDGEGLLRAALAAPARRVAVKRPSKAPALGGIEPMLRMEATQARYDVYLTP